MIEIWFHPKTEQDVFDYLGQVRGSYCRQADLIVTNDTPPGLVAVLFDKLRDTEYELEGVSNYYDRLGNSLVSLRRKKNI